MLATGIPNTRHNILNTVFFNSHTSGTGAHTGTKYKPHSSSPTIKSGHLYKLTVVIFMHLLPVLINSV